jgi:hypothetical protein
MGGRFDANGKFLSYKSDAVRTSARRKVLGGQIAAQEILQHVMACEKECPELGITLDTLFETVSAYQQQAG